MKNIIISVVATAVIVGSGSFFGGMQYAKSQTTDMGDFAGRFGNMDQSQRQGMGSVPGGFARGQAGGGFVSGEILSVDEQSMTVKLPDGGSKLVFFSDSSKINITTEGSQTDLATGTNMTVTGTSNDDGSVTANTIQILPVGSSLGAPSATPTEE